MNGHAGMGESKWQETMTMLVLLGKEEARDLSRRHTKEC